MITRSINFVRGALARTLLPKWWKESNELAYWKAIKDAEGNFSNAHYLPFYTTFFGLGLQAFAGKAILDIGCGPRGSLEWAENAQKRIGLDPLANDYLKLGGDKHQMKYVAALSERMPFEDCSFDFVYSFNSLDHVASVTCSAKEIVRVLKPNGLFMLIVDINHPPTACEPHNLSPKTVVDLFVPPLELQTLRVFKPTVPGSVYKSIIKGEEYDDPKQVTAESFLTASFQKQ